MKSAYRRSTANADFNNKFLFFRLGTPSGQNHFHESIELEYCIRGTCEIQLFSQSFTLQPGGTAVFNTMEPHTLIPSEDYYGFRLTLIRDFLLGARNSASDTEVISPLFEQSLRIRNHILPDPELRALLDRMAAEAAAVDGYWSLSYKSDCFLLLALLLRHYTEPVNLRRDEYYISPAVRAREIIDRRYYEPLTIEGLAGMIGVSRRQLERAFLKEYGITPCARLQQRRCNIASGLLKKTDRSISEISALVGFRSDVCFRAAFRQRFGVAPTEYRLRSRASVPQS